MLFKAADDRQPDIEALGVLLKRPDVYAPTRSRIEDQIRTISAGWKGEKDAAYEIEFYFGKSRNYATIHDLRIEHDGQVAQIDHLIIDRLLEVWLCESKHFSDGVSINEHGEWSRYFGGRPQGVPSPIEQNRRHMRVLERMFNASVVRLPQRAFLPIKPDVKPVVLVSNNTHIRRPIAIEGIETVIKAEKLASSTSAPSSPTRGPGDRTAHARSLRTRVGGVASPRQRGLGRALRPCFGPRTSAYRGHPHASR